MTVALAGNPNSGKTTVFNAMTGLRQKVANYPGVTVEKKTGYCTLSDGTWASIVDLPGTYSLISRSPDELVAMEVLRGLRKDTPPPDVVVVVVDASNLQRNLYLVSQLVELGRPLVVALNMMDVARRRGLCVDPQALQRELGVPVVPVIAHKRQGIEQLKEAVLQARVAPMPDWSLPQEMKEELVVVGGGLAILDSQDAEAVPVPVSHLSTDVRRLDRYQAFAERLLIGDHAEDLQDLARREPVVSLLSSAVQRLNSLGIDPMQADIEAHYRWIERVAAGCVAAADGSQTTDSSGYAEADTASPKHLSERIDAILIHKVFGLLVFCLVMAMLFVSMFWLASPIMSAIKVGMNWLGSTVSSPLAGGPLKSLLQDGIFAGVGAVVLFVPQIAILFLFLAVLEDSGYLARAAFLMDRLLDKVGLHGKSFIPLLSSFACAVPGIMATRTIENRKDRLAAILVAPFMTCSARLPIYVLLVGTFFAGYGPWVQGVIMCSLYLLGIAAAASVAWLLRRTLLKGPSPAFILELPTYKVPQVPVVARQVWHNMRHFLMRAGTTICCLSILLWAIAYYPRLPREQASRCDSPNALAAAQRAYSVAGRVGHAIEPVIRPIGFDWKMGVGCLSAFAAREVFVSTMAILYGTGDAEAGTEDLAAAMRRDVRADGRPVWTPLVACSVLLWFAMAMQCTSTLVVVRQETGGWKWPVFMLVYMNALAYVACLVLYQGGSLLWGR